MKKMDTNTYLDVIREVVEQGREVSITITGSSMSPFLAHHRDQICFRKPDKPLKRGDMVFYQRRNGQYIMHRIVKVTNSGYNITGDAQTLIEKNVQREQIFAIVVKVCRKNKWIGPGNFWWEFFEKVWIHLIPIRHPIVKLYGVCSRLWRR